MEQEYLPGTLRTRVLDLMKEHKVTQSDLALRIGMSESTLSRFLRSNSDKLSSEQVLQIARAFNVSTDFLLGETNIPDRMNYDISELGLSAQATRNLYTGKVHPNVVNRLLENQRFKPVRLSSTTFRQIRILFRHARNRFRQQGTMLRQWRTMFRQQWTLFRLNGISFRQGRTRT